MDARPFVRQGALAQKRSNFQGSHFPIAKDFARKAAVVPLRNSNRPFNNNAMPNANKKVTVHGTKEPFDGADVVSPWVLQAPQQQQQQQGDGGIKPRIQTLDAMFANMKEQRTRASLQQQNNGIHQFNAVRQNNGVRHNNWGQHRNPNFSRRGVPWARNRFAN
ncbi:hypothetical protein LINGRAHAP2_LOCUS3026 [Linum grandiflorum]